MPSESRIVKWAVELHWNKRDFICRRTKEFQLRGQGEEARSLGIKASHKLENHSIFAQKCERIAEISFNICSASHKCEFISEVSQMIKNI